MSEGYPTKLLELFTLYDKLTDRIESEDEPTKDEVIAKLGEVRKLFLQRRWRIYRTEDGGEYLRPELK